MKATLFKLLFFTIAGLTFFYYYSFLWQFNNTYPGSTFRVPVLLILAMALACLFYLAVDLRFDPKPSPQKRRNAQQDTEASSVSITRMDRD